MKVVALAGGVGGAKLADGLARVLKPAELTIIVNTGDDFSHFGLRICPDLDTVCYTLAGMANPQTGWGRKDDTWNVMEHLREIGAPTWFNLGDRDLATHLERTRRLAQGERLSEITRQFCDLWGIQCSVVPMSDDQMETWVETLEAGWIPFQEYFVLHRCELKVKGFEFRGREKASPAPGVMDAIQKADSIIVCPSNPWVSITPIVEVPGIMEEITRSDAIRIAISPIIQGKTIKGPAAKMYAEMGIQPSATAVARHYSSWIHGFVMDVLDQQERDDVMRLGVEVLLTDTIMTDVEKRVELAQAVLEFSEKLSREIVKP